MPDKLLQEQLLDRLSELSRIVTEHQVFLLALVAYLREQPSYDASRFWALYEQHREQLKLPKIEAIDPDAALQALLRAFDGPIQ